MRAPADPAVSTFSDTALNPVAIAQLASKRIFFGHQSVGGNIVDGVRELAAESPEVHLSVVKSATPEAVKTPALIEASLGENGAPATKSAAFVATIDRGLGASGGIAVFKYCYLDMGPDTDPAQLFESYRGTMDSLTARYPKLTLVHVTMPLTSVEPAPKRLLKQLLGKTTAVELNAKRHAYNERLRATYGGKASVFDLAKLESTGRRGRRVGVMQGKTVVPQLAPEWTDDGGHLNAAGRRMVAREFVALLARL